MMAAYLLRLMLTRALPIALHARWLQLRAWDSCHDLRITRVEGDRVTLRLSGDATARQVPSAIGHFRNAIDSQKRVVLDLSETRIADGRFLGLLLMLRRKLLNGRGATRNFPVSREA